MNVKSPILWSCALAAAAFGCWSPQPHPVQPPQVFYNSIGIEMRRIPRGDFLFGKHSKGVGAQEISQLPVTISSDFYMATTEVTIGQFRKFLTDSGYHSTYQPPTDASECRLEYGDQKEFASQFQINLPENGMTWDRPGWEVTDDHPVVLVTFEDAEEFCRWLSKCEGKTYRLPTEAEWEYCCRAGHDSIYPNGNTLEELTNYDNLAGKSFFSQVNEGREPLLPWKWNEIPGDDGFVFSSPVKQFPANDFGLFDMGGNVSEMCYPTSWGKYIGRGGNWGTMHQHAAVASFRVYLQAQRDDNTCRFFHKIPPSVLGFRIVLQIE